MEVVNLLHFEERAELRLWLKENHNKEKCCWEGLTMNEERLTLSGGGER